ncbi:MAG: hypothetical protein AB2L11_02890 [Syntrophobacteraceae bacterium]
MDGVFSLKHLFVTICRWKEGKVIDECHLSFKKAEFIIFVGDAAFAGIGVDYALYLLRVQLTA